MVSLSGGKDSTAMLLRLIEEKRPIDLILFCDTGLEFPQMYDHLKKLEQYIGRKITYLKAEHGFEYYFFDYMPKRKNPKLEQYSGMNWAGPYNRWCTAMLKTRIIAKYLKELKKCMKSSSISVLRQMNPSVSKAVAIRWWNGE